MVRVFGRSVVPQEIKSVRLFDRSAVRQPKSKAFVCSMGRLFGRSTTQKAFDCPSVRVVGRSLCTPASSSYRENTKREPPSRSLTPSWAEPSAWCFPIIEVSGVVRICLATVS